MTNTVKQRLADAGLRVKPLEWDDGCYFGSFRVSTLCGNFQITRIDGLWFYKGKCFLDGLESAELAAQADYEARILAALEVME